MLGNDFVCACLQGAHEWYEAGYRHGHFASVWQRSLYNVPGLRAQPWWTAKETGYTDLVRVLNIYIYTYSCGQKFTFSHLGHDNSGWIFHSSWQNR